MATAVGDPSAVAVARVSLGWLTREASIWDDRCAPWLHGVSDVISKIASCVVDVLCCVCDAPCSTDAFCGTWSLRVASITPRVIREYGCGLSLERLSRGSWSHACLTGVVCGAAPCGPGCFSSDLACRCGLFSAHSGKSYDASSVPTRGYRSKGSYRAPRPGERRESRGPPDRHAILRGGILCLRVKFHRDTQKLKVSSDDGCRPWGSVPQNGRRRYVSKRAPSRSCSNCLSWFSKKPGSVANLGGY
jgi:hypothetical protein